MRVTGVSYCRYCKYSSVLPASLRADSGRRDLNWPETPTSDGGTPTSPPQMTISPSSMVQPRTGGVPRRARRCWSGARSNFCPSRKYPPVLDARFGLCAGSIMLSFIAGVRETRFFHATPCPLPTKRKPDQRQVPGADGRGLDALGGMKTGASRNLGLADARRRVPDSGGPGSRQMTTRQPSLSIQGQRRLPCTRARLGVTLRWRGQPSATGCTNDPGQSGHTSMDVVRSCGVPPDWPTGGLEQGGQGGQDGGLAGWPVGVVWDRPPSAVAPEPKLVVAWVQRAHPPPPPSPSTL